MTELLRATPPRMWSHLHSATLKLQPLQLHTSSDPGELTDERMNTRQAVELLERGEAIKCVSHPLNPHAVGRSFYRNPSGMWVYTPRVAGKWNLIDNSPDAVQHALLTWKEGTQWVRIPKPDVEGNTPLTAVRPSAT